MNAYEDPARGDFPPLGTLSVWFGVLLIFMTAVSGVLVANPGQIRASPLLSSLRLFLVALILGSFLFFIFRIHYDFKQAAIPLIVNVGTFLIINFVPFAALWQQVRFQWHWQAYNEVVELVLSGAIQPDPQGSALLPYRYRILSAEEGSIRIETDGNSTSVFFFTSYRTPQNFAGYLYRSDRNPPQSGEFGGRWRFVAEQKPHWFYCTSY